ncbi:MAG: winged helix DNA-binding protein [Pseudomonadota bacterium]
MQGGFYASGPIGDPRPEVVVISDGTAGTLRAHVEACGLRVAETLSFGEAGAFLQQRQGASLALVEIETPLSEEIAGVLETLDVRAIDSRMPAIVSCGPSILDAVAAHLAAPYATILCDPSPADWVVALHMAMPNAIGVAETSRAAEVRHLLALTDEVSRIARVIAGLPQEGRSTSVSDGLAGYRGPPSRSPVEVEARDIRNIIRWRRRRDASFVGDLFADPAWDMMLDLAAARLEGREVAVSSLCIAAAVPPTTALRWIKTLTDSGMFERVADPHDRRRVHIQLSDQVADAVFLFLGEAKGAGAALI